MIFSKATGGMLFSGAPIHLQEKDVQIVSIRWLSGHPFFVQKEAYTL